jgi:hypothetical protein
MLPLYFISVTTSGGISENSIQGKIEMKQILSMADYLYFKQ